MCLVTAKVVAATVFSYNAEPSQTDSSPCQTASMMNICPFPEKRIVANNCLEFGTQVEIAGEIYEVQDRMNKRYGCEVYDILVSTKEEAIQWGKRKINAIIYER